MSFLFYSVFRKTGSPERYSIPLVGQQNGEHVGRSSLPATTTTRPIISPTTKGKYDVGCSVFHERTQLCEESPGTGGLKNNVCNKQTFVSGYPSGSPVVTIWKSRFTFRTPSPGNVRKFFDNTIFCSKHVRRDGVKVGLHEA